MNKAAQRPFAVFDIDGTLIRWQLYHAVVDKLAAENLLGKDTHQKLHAARMVWKNREHSEAFRTYEIEVVNTYEAALKTLKTSDFDRVVDEVVQEYSGQVYRFTRSLIARLKAQNYLLFAISGSHQELVERVTDQYGFDECVGTVYFRGDAHFTGESQTPRSNKQAVLNGLIDKYNARTADSYAVGDSLSDASLLEAVENPIAFNPDQELFYEAQANNWPIVVERKNVIYELETSSSGEYRLKKSRS